MNSYDMQAASPLSWTPFEKFVLFSFGLFIFILLFIFAWNTTLLAIGNTDNGGIIGFFVNSLLQLVE